MELEKGSKYEITKPDGDWKGFIYIWDIKGDSVRLKSVNGIDICIDTFRQSEIAGLCLKKVELQEMEDFYGYGE